MKGSALFEQGRRLLKFDGKSFFFEVTKPFVNLCSVLLWSETSICIDFKFQSRFQIFEQTANHICVHCVIDYLLKYFCIKDDTNA